MEEPQSFPEATDPLQDEKDAAILARETAPADIPIANVLRIMKSALPENAKIAKEAKECVQECISEFISFVTSEASEKCSQEKRKTVNGEDVLFAMTSLGFENYGEALKIYLTKYRQNAKMLEEKQESGPGTKRGKKRKPEEADEEHAGDMGGPSDAIGDGQPEATGPQEGEFNGDYEEFEE